MLKLTCYIHSSRRTMRCSLWRSTFFLTVRTSEQCKTNCIRVNCVIYGNNNRRGEKDFFQEFQTCRDMFYHVFLHIFCRKPIYVRLYERLYIHTYIHTYIRTYIRGLFKKYREFCVFSKIIYLFMNIYFVPFKVIPIRYYALVPTFFSNPRSTSKNYFL